MPLLLLLIAVAGFVLVLLIPGLTLVAAGLLGGLALYGAWIVGALLWFWGLLMVAGNKKVPPVLATAWMFLPAVVIVWAIYKAAGG